MALQLSVDLVVFCIFMCESSYCFQRVLAIAILSACLSVRQKRCKLGFQVAWKTLVSGTVKLFHKFEGGQP